MQDLKPDEVYRDFTLAHWLHAGIAPTFRSTILQLQEGCKCRTTDVNQFAPSLLLSSSPHKSILLISCIHQMLTLQRNCYHVTDGLTFCAVPEWSVCAMWAIQGISQSLSPHHCLLFWWALPSSDSWVQQQQASVHSRSLLRAALQLLQACLPASAKAQSPAQASSLTVTSNCPQVPLPATPST